MFAPTAKRDGSVPLLARPLSSSRLSFFTPTTAQTLSHLIELNAEDEHKDIVYTRYILSLLAQNRCFPVLERLVFVGRRIRDGRQAGQGGVRGRSRRHRGRGASEGGNPKVLLTCFLYVRICEYYSFSSIYFEFLRDTLSFRRHIF
ncbi:hypothetical protein GYMLUDRAFT_407162 [Collybiopsis luxurians FD-317 M1]|uniref:Uncharacterized protein n=1 Tax=Collybiopsis luxurians FD-317 M1 TaxID=944289 RepID=A0A0D0BA39_9AGAR|nr:hypothetical protein GYMLUDRAFT_407162 [Collybiopsis luxurians FD-317 M1]